MIPYLPAEKANGAAVIVCPGGAYGMLALSSEGEGPAAWLNRMGVAAFILRYRFGPRHPYPAPMQDALAALRWVRAHAAECHVDPRRVGMLGFSAGGHLTAVIAVRGAAAADGPKPGNTAVTPDVRPAFQILIYPVITMEQPFGHRASRINLLGRNPAPELSAFVSAERDVPAGTPPAFIVHAKTDPIVDFANSAAYAEALRKAGTSASLLAFEHGGHAFGLGNGRNAAPDEAELSTWPGRCERWLDSLGMLKKHP